MKRIISVLLGLTLFAAIAYGIFSKSVSSENRPSSVPRYASSATELA